METQVLKIGNLVYKGLGLGHDQVQVLYGYSSVGL